MGTPGCGAGRRWLKGRGVSETGVSQLGQRSSAQTPGLSWASQPLSLPASLDRAAGEWWLLLCRALSPGKVAEVGETCEAVTSPV